VEAGILMRISKRSSLLKAWGLPSLVGEAWRRPPIAIGVLTVLSMAHFASFAAAFGTQNQAGIGIRVRMRR